MLSKRLSPAHSELARGWRPLSRAIIRRALIYRRAIFFAKAIGTAVISLELASVAIAQICFPDTYPAWTKLSNTILRPALSKSTVSLLPSTVATVPVPNFA
jgi:hypothetical protein